MLTLDIIIDNLEDYIGSLKEKNTRLNEELIAVKNDNAELLAMLDRDAFEAGNATFRKQEET